MTVGNELLDTALIEKLGWTIFHSVWEGLVIALAVAVPLYLLANKSARLRYAVACSALLCLVLSPIVTFICLSGQFDDPEPLIVLGGPLSLPTGGALLNILHTTLPWVLYCWLIVLALLTIRNLFGWIYLKWSFTAGSVPLREERKILCSLTNYFNIKRTVHFAESWIDSPVTTGWLRPVILLPAAPLNEISLDQLRLLVAHELAHICRHDHLVQLFQLAARSILFYNPAMWWVCRQINIEREHCCDDMATAIAGSGDRIEYARALLAMESARVFDPGLALSANDGSIVDRITRLMVEPSLRRGTPPSLWSVLVTAGSALFFAELVFASSSVKPIRELTDIPPVSAHIYQLLHVRAGRGDVLASIEGFLNDSSRRAADDAAYARLARGVLTDDRPDALGQEILSKIELRNAGSYADRNWRYGTTFQRLEMIKKIQSRVDANPVCEQSTAEARTAMLLAGQECALFGALPLSALLRDSIFLDRARLSTREVEQLRQLVSDHMKIGRIATRLWVSADTLLSHGLTDDSLPQFTRLLSQMTSIGRVRPDVEWLTAEVIARAVTLHQKPNEVNALRRTTETQLVSPEFGRWMGEPPNQKLDRGTTVMRSEDFFKNAHFIDGRGATSRPQAAQ